MYIIQIQITCDVPIWKEKCWHNKFTYGNYSPDWAVVCRKDALKDPSIGIYFIVETKAGKTWADLTDVEKNKIHCGELHFQAVSDDTKFDWVNSYEDFINKIGAADTNRETI